MDVKELLMTALAVAVGFIIGSIVISKFPKLTGNWESDYEVE